MTTDTTTPTPVPAVVDRVVRGADAFTSLGIDPITDADASAIYAAPGGPDVLAYLASDLMGWASAVATATSATADVNRSAATARDDLAAGYRVDPAHVVRSAERFADAIVARQHRADDIVRTVRIARAMIGA